MFDLIIGLSGEWGLEDDYKTEKSPSVIRIYTSDGTLILEELCLVARDESSKAIAAVGNEVKMAKESGATGLIYCEAVAERKIIDYPTAQIMFFYYIKKAEQLTKKHLRKPNVIVCNLPAELTQVDRKAYDDVLREAGALDVILSEMSSHELLQNGPLGEIQSQEEPGKKVKCRYIIEVGEENQ